jgi:hypothetical protein
MSKDLSQTLYKKGHYQPTIPLSTEAEIIAKMIFNKGNVPWNKGRRMSKEFRTNTSLAHIGLKYPNRKRHVFTKEHREHISKGVKKWWSANRERIILSRRDSYKYRKNKDKKKNKDGQGQ